MLPLLEHRVDVDAQDTEQRTPLHMAVYEGKLEATRLLLEHYANSCTEEGGPNHIPDCVGERTPRDYAAAF